MQYSLDTSALIDCWERHYPQDIFPTLWEKLDAMIDRGELLVSEELLIELERKTTGLHDWVKKKKNLICKTDSEIQIATSEILEKFPRMVDSSKGRSMGDPWVIAVAKVRNCIVVTNERSSGTNERPRIPTVCDHYNVKWIPTVKFLRQQGWSF